jgi:hydrogenase 3 maturation protease
VAAGSGEPRLEDTLRGRVVIVGVGNVLRGDDALGPLLVQKLERRLGLPCIDAGSTPENHLGRVVREDPDTVLLVDAVELGLRPGAHALLQAGQLEERGLSTHDVSLRLCLEELGRRIRGKVFLLGVQPLRLAFGQRMSRAIRRAVRLLERRICAALSAGRME